MNRGKRSGGATDITFRAKDEPVSRKRARSTLTETVADSSDMIADLQEKLDRSEATRETLLKKIEDLEKELASQGNVQNLFKQVKKPTREMPSGAQSGSAKTYSSQLKAVGIACLGEGIPGATIKKVLDIVAYSCELLVTPEHSVPKADWFCKLRNELQPLNDRQLLNFCQNAEYLCVSFDETSLRKKKPGCLGLTDQTGSFMAVSFNDTIGNNSVQVSQAMWEAIDSLSMTNSRGISLATLIRRKLVAIMSDRSRVQEAANKHFARLLNAHPDRNGLDDVAVLVCFMHTVVNAEDYFTRKLDVETLRVFSLIRRIFGCRTSSGNPFRCCL